MVQSVVRRRVSRSKLAPKTRAQKQDSNERFAKLEREVTSVLKPYAYRISVFGSYARGDNTVESDIDLLVALKPSGKRPALGLFGFIQLEEDLKKRLGCDVDLVTEDGLNHRRKSNIEKDRVVIYEEK